MVNNMRHKNKPETRLWGKKQETISKLLNFFRNSYSLL